MATEENLDITPELHRAIQGMLIKKVIEILTDGVLGPKDLKLLSDVTETIFASFD